MRPSQRSFALVGLCSALSAQVDRASLKGTVTDSTGAVIADATVTVESVSTGTGQRPFRTSALGAYQIPGVFVGVYKVSVGESSFNTIRFENVVLAVGQSRTLDAQLPSASFLPQSR